MTAIIDAITRREAETAISRNAQTILDKRYLEGESVDSMWDRVSGGDSRFRGLLSGLRFLPNSPTLFNAGRNNGCTLSACFVFDVADNMRDTPDSICGTRDKAIAVAKAGGGVGYYFGNLRPKGSPIKSIQRVACGPVAVLKDYHGVSQLITQGGKRELAQMGVLPAWHQDIRGFIHCKDADPQSLGSFNISVSWSDQMMTDALSLTPGHEQDLWREQCKAAWSHGCPGMFWPDTVNRHNPNPHLGTANAPNPCGETPNRTDEPCNLGSLALARYYKPSSRGIDWNLLEEDVVNSIWFLDDILDRNIFPHPDITAAALLTRKLGLGVMGWADLLGMMHVHYDTQEAVDLGEKLMEFINTVAGDTSVSIAKIKGPYRGYSETKTKGPNRRNETVTSIAPTGTIAIIANVWGSIEPHFALRCERTTNEGIKLQDGIPDWIWERMEGFRPKIASEIAPEWHVRHQAAFQRHTELGVSKTVNLPHSASVEDVSNTYRLMYELGCKGGTIFRDGCRDEQVLVSKDKEKTKSVYQTNGNGHHGGNGKTPQTPQTLAERGTKRKLPSRRNSITEKFLVGGTEGYLTVGLYQDGKPGEIFLRVSKIGSAVSGMLDTWAISFSLALQHGTPLEALIQNHEGTRFEPAGLTGNKEIPVATSIPDYVVRWLKKEFLSGECAGRISGSFRSGQLCPDCGTEAVFSAGCLTCPQEGCGWSKCG